jgi:hypothetical protein
MLERFITYCLAHEATRFLPLRDVAEEFRRSREGMRAD